MRKPTRAALAFKPRTGRAVLVVLSDDAQGPRVIERAEIALLPAGEMAPYHAAEGLASKAADTHVKAAIGRARRLAQDAVREAAKRCTGAARRMGVTRARLDSDLAALGKAAGPPWGRYQKEAAAAALVVLGNRGG